MIGTCTESLRDRVVFRVVDDELVLWERSVPLGPRWLGPRLFRVAAVLGALFRADGDMERARKTCVVARQVLARAIAHQRFTPIIGWKPLYPGARQERKERPS